MHTKWQIVKYFSAPSWGLNTTRYTKKVSTCQPDEYIARSYIQDQESFKDLRDYSV